MTNVNYGTCEKCGAEKVLNPKTDKVFCKNKCWLKTQNASSTQNQSQYAPQSTYNPQNAPTEQIGAKNGNGEVNWDKISFGKCKTLFLVELMKMGKSLQEAELEAELWATASMRKN